MAGLDEECRCGHRDGSGGIPCSMCWDHTVDTPLLRLMIEKARRVEDNAYPLLMQVGDPSAAPLLRPLVEDPDPWLRKASVVALGWSGDLDDIARIGRRLRDEEGMVRAAAIDTITELGGPSAPDLLWGVAEGHEYSRDATDQRLALCGLAWLGDGRAAGPLRESMSRWLADCATLQDLFLALLRAGQPNDVDFLVDSVNALVPAAAGDAEVRARLKGAVEAAVFAVGQEAPERRSEVWERLSAAVALLVEGGYPWVTKAFPNPHDVRPAPVHPLGPQTVPSKVLRYGVPRAGGGGERGAKFRGQPDWAGEPAWPVGADGPLPFYGQLPISGSRTAYIFIGEAGWEPLGSGNAVVVQPGPPPHLPTQPLREGPQIHTWVAEDPPRYRDRSRRRPALEIPVALQDSADPVTWEWPAPDPVRPYGDNEMYRNKIGGTPLWLQGEQWPPGDGWTFAFQFTAASAGEELADGAECYGFINDGGRAALLWQCR
jgi:hypothetical protein